MPTGLTEAEEAKWCKSKKDYKPLLKIPKDKRTKKQQEDLERMAQEYRDWHRYQDIKQNGPDKGPVKYNPKYHTSKIFDEFKEGS